jgi:hypothetical protein
MTYQAMVEDQRQLIAGFHKENADLRALSPNSTRRRWRTLRVVGGGEADGAAG